MGRWPLLLNAVVVCATCCAAQQQTDIADMASRSGIIFRGTVLAVVVEPARSPGEMAVSRISFRVDDAIRGTQSQHVHTIRQWKVAEDEYRVGESLVLFLYPVNELGVTSPVGGRNGHLRVEDVPVEALNQLRESSPVAPQPPSSGQPQRPTRPGRGGSQ